MTQPTVHNWIGDVADWGVDSVMMHGRTAQQRYTKTADYEYLGNVKNILGDGCLFVGNGDVYHPSQVTELNNLGISNICVGRGALYKPWIFKELNEGKLYDISGTERMDILRNFCNYGLEFWGSDQAGVEMTRRYLLEFLSFFTRYVPLGLIADGHTQYLNLRSPSFSGRNDTETILASDRANDWVSISEMFLGKVGPEFNFVPKHRSKV
ncbi:hypothetical protein GEMRC1_004705 [Eukaryota sp. GEM-RC1]